MADKKPEIPAPGDETLPCSLLDLALFPAGLTVGTALVALVIALISGGPEVITLVAGLVLGFAAVSFSVTFLSGGLGLIPAVLRRLYRRFARLRGHAIRPNPVLRDAWVDGP